MVKVLNIPNNGIHINNILMLVSSSCDNGTVLEEMRFTVADHAYQRMTLIVESPVGLQLSTGTRVVVLLQHALCLIQQKVNTE